MRQLSDLSASLPALLWALPILAALAAGCGWSAPLTVNLHRAVQVGDLDQIRRHIAAGTDLNQRDGNGDLSLHLAVRAGQVAIARELADHGAALDGGGHTPLELALTHGKDPGRCPAGAVGRPSGGPGDAGHPGACRGL